MTGGVLTRVLQIELADPQAVQREIFQSITFTEDLPVMATPLKH